MKRKILLVIPLIVGIVLVVYFLQASNSQQTLESDFQAHPATSSYSSIQVQTAISSDVPTEEEQTMKIVLTVNGESHLATLNNSLAARDFYHLLPIDLVMRDYAQSEKIADLPQELDTSDSPAGTSASVGDLTLFKPWGNLAIFYQEIDYSTGLIPLGRIDGSIDFLLNQEGSFTLSISQA